jgi:hypothetical protein
VFAQRHVEFTFKGVDLKSVIIIIIITATTTTNSEVYIGLPLASCVHRDSMLQLISIAIAD